MNLKRLLGIGARKAARMAADQAVRSELAKAEARLELLTDERDYWKARCETLIDAALVKNGHTPVMVNTPASTQAQPHPFAGLRVTEVGEAPKS